VSGAPEDLIRAQIEYYRARAGEYDDWFYRKGRYDRGPDLNAAWFRDVADAERAVDAWIPEGRVLELAAGTGIWTERLAARARHVTAVDASSEVLAVNQRRIVAARLRGRTPAGPRPSPRSRPLADVSYVPADLFTWLPPERYDGVFFGFWLSHVPPHRFETFWDLVRACLAPGGTVCFVDSRYDPTSTARDHRLLGEESTTVLRRLDDGREYRIVKVFYRAQELTERLAGLGWRITIRETERYFLCGSGGRNRDPA
jgi:demethylmenaquinone methyltransferase/2-methoxy-6-polyprenyl-1,4-benzoquinol methylase